MSVPAGDSEAVVLLDVTGTGQMPSDPNFLGCQTWLAWAKVSVYEQGAVDFPWRRRYFEIPVTFRPNSSGVYSLDGEPCLGTDRIAAGGSTVYLTRQFFPSLNLSIFAGPDLVDAWVDEGGVIGGAIPPVYE